MNFKSFYLLEASTGFNYIRLFVDKIERVLRDFSKNRDRYSKYETKFGYEIPISDIIDSSKFKKFGILEKLTSGNLYLYRGLLDFKNEPVIRKQEKDSKGEIVFRDQKGFYNITKSTIGIPFINHENDKTFYAYIDKISSTLYHEFAHKLQAIRGYDLKATANKTEKAWFEDEHEREALFTQIYKELEKRIKLVFRDMKIDKEQYSKTKDEEYRKEYILNYNVLYSAFKDEEGFNRFVNNSRWVIENTNKLISERMTYLRTNFKEEWDEFITDTWLEMKNEFRNVIPTKKLEINK